ncbi:MAG TPA: helix-turn-helix domain-containing protein [Gemmatimonadales bacterium]|nr:helix-turn-helix domain-containing protein [Gemmatimonadales bacterium]
MTSAEQHSLPEALWTVADVVAFTRMRRTWVYERIARNELPHYRLGGAVRFNPPEIRAWLEQNRARGVARLPPEVTLRK